MKVNNQKLCEITDVIPVRIFPDRAKKMGPIKPMMMSEDTIFLILNGRPAPKHFFAVDPNNRTRKVLLTKDNYNKTTEELFGNTTKDKEYIPDIPDKSVVVESNSSIDDIEPEVLTETVDTNIGDNLKLDLDVNIDNTINTNEVQINDSIKVDDIDISVSTGENTADQSAASIDNTTTESPVDESANNEVVENNTENQNNSSQNNNNYKKNNYNKKNRKNN